jgi:hypothetical protein
MEMNGVDVEVAQLVPAVDNFKLTRLSSLVASNAVSSTSMIEGMPVVGRTCFLSPITASAETTDVLTGV